MLTLVRQRAPQKVRSALYYLLLILLLCVTLKQSIVINLLKFYSEQKFVWFCYLVVLISTLHFWKQLPVLHAFFC